MEKIVCAAIHYKDKKCYEFQPKNISEGYVLCGWRHHNIINTRAQLLEENQKTDSYNSVQGFLTSKNRFLDRAEAFKLAIENGQVIRENAFHSYKLFSEDLY